ncbi:MAG: hypothetical protein A3K10_02145 [Bacteroidetes bacterium RIFCSPLOWO2_12_FULL_31_6]|nr:MAG: hypothetical protein A3K10_02145 [Bacteroidetes bacterium RIFCSPLOWO2_12_FULL_31_6]
MAKNKTITVKGIEITIIKQNNSDYISITDMLKAKDGDFFISDWLRNRNTVEFLGIWESVYNPNFNYGEFATIKIKNMAKNKTIKVDSFEIILYSQNNEDFISLTDMARYRDAERTNYIIQNWLRTRHAIDFCGLWEQMYNPNFKRIEFDEFKNKFNRSIYE